MMNKCERCSGSGTMRVTGFITRKSGCSPVADEPFTCFDCGGTGSVSDLTLKLRRIGSYVKERRRELDVSQREQAELLGMNFQEFNAWQHGRV